METKDNGDLWEAVATGKIDILKQRWKKDVSLLYKCKLGCFDQSILHVVTSHGRLEDVNDILSHDPELAEVLDSRSWSPLHVAAVKGHTHVLLRLIPRNHHVARVKTDQGDTILHLCVKQNGLDALKMLLKNIRDSEFVNRKDAEGNTILHLAVMLGHKQIVEYLLNDTMVDIYSKNENGNTVLNIACQNNQVGGMKDIENRLRTFGANEFHGTWLAQKRDSFMIVASLIATMAFQACVSPPGGVWQDTKDGHKAGESVMAFHYRNEYQIFLQANTIGFMGSLSTILLLITGSTFKKKIMIWVLILIMWVTVIAMLITFAISIFAVTPKIDKRVFLRPLMIVAIVWACLMILQFSWDSLALLNTWLLRNKDMHPCPNFFTKYFRFCSLPTRPRQETNL